MGNKYEIEPCSAHICQWEVEPEWCEDHFRDVFQNLVGVEVRDVNGEIVRLFHVHAFLDDPEGAQRMVERVNKRGVIDSDHWGHHGYLSLSLEERLNGEAYREQYEREDEDWGTKQYNDWLGNYCSVVIGA